jgi:hypothetical protein
MKIKYSIKYQKKKKNEIHLKIINKWEKLNDDKKKEYKNKAEHEY